MKSILVVDSENLRRSSTCSALRSSGYFPIEAESYFSAKEILKQTNPSLAIVDYQLSKSGNGEFESGIDLLTEIRSDNLISEFPVILMTPCCDENIRILGLQKGADDVLSSPVSPTELVLRINNLLKRTHETDTDTGNVFSVDGITLNLQSFIVSVDGNAMDLSLSEFRLLYNFVQHPNKVFTRSELRQLSKSREHELDERSIDVYVMRLRRSLQRFGKDKAIQTVRGLGYRFSAHH